MTDNTYIQGYSPENSVSKTISLSEAYAIQYWTEELGISEGELFEAVEIMGPSPDKVRKYLN
ncbi:MAG: DUF3606 domain-containing protein [Micavibrio sp.]|nr:DUF3606 domain-containing protein [Micavibrio sp.]